MKQNKTGKYLKYAIGEIVLVMIGILLALQVNNWNENRKELQYEIKILNEMLNDLNTNYKEIDGIRNMAITTFKNLGNQISNLDNNKPINSNFKFLVRVGGFFNNANTTYELIENSGLNVLSNDAIRLKITYMYENNFYNILKREDNLTEFYNSSVHNFRVKYFRHSHNKDAMNSYDLIPIDSFNVFENNEFRSIIFYIRGEMQARDIFMSNILDDLQKLIQDTKQEIIRLET